LPGGGTKEFKGGKLKALGKYWDTTDKGPRAPIEEGEI